MKSNYQGTLFLTIVSFVMLFLVFSVPEEMSASGKPDDRGVAVAGQGGPEGIVLFSAKDSVAYHLDRRTMELWGNAALEHEGTTVRAPRIILDVDASLLRASGASDALNKPERQVFFSDRQGSFYAGTMSYNFRTRRGESSNVSSGSERIQFTGKEVTRLENGTLVAGNATFSACNEAEPHYWFSSPSMTFNADSGVSARSLVMYVRPEIFSKRLPAIPVLFLPSMTIPSKPERSSGFLVPNVTTFAESTALSNIGYFWAINDYADARTDGDIALNGSWRLGERFRYVKRNAFSGEIAAEYKRYTIQSSMLQSGEWNARIVHNQLFDASAKLDAVVQLQGGSRHHDLNSMNIETILTEQTNSRAALAKTFNDEQSIATLALNRSDDLRNHHERLFAGATFWQNRLYPFRPDQDNWSPDISVTGSAGLSVGSLSLSGVTSSGYAGYANGEMGYYHEFSDGYKALFTQGISLQSMNSLPGLYNDTYTGMRVMLPLRMQSTLFHHLSINPGLTWIRSLRADGDGHQFSTTLFSVDASTRLYASVQTGLFDKMFGLRALRHTFVPVISYRWNAPFSALGYDTPLNHAYDWPNSVQSGSFVSSSQYAALPAGQSTVGITLNNLLHGKFRGATSLVQSDSLSEHTGQLLSLSISTAINTAAGSFRLAPLSLIASSNVLSSNLLLSTGGMYDVYSYNPVTGERINRYNRDDGRGVLRFVKGFFDMSFVLQSGRQKVTAAAASLAPFAPYAEQMLFPEPFGTLDWQFRVALFLQTDQTNPLQGTHDKLLNFSAKVALSRQWQAGMNTGYDFENGKVVFPMVQLYRDLHCWQFGFQWVPSGAFKGYALQLGLKPL